MKKLKLDLQDLEIESFATTPSDVDANDGTVFANATRWKGCITGAFETCNNPTDPCNGCITGQTLCDGSCITECGTCHTCNGHTCNGTCNATCYNTCGESCHGTCAPPFCLNTEVCTNINGSGMC